jgi:hypothetical protein
MSEHKATIDWKPENGDFPYEHSLLGCGSITLNTIEGGNR